VNTAAITIAALDRLGPCLEPTGHSVDGPLSTDHIAAPTSRASAPCRVDDRLAIACRAERPAPG